LREREGKDKWGEGQREAGGADSPLSREPDVGLWGSIPGRTLGSQPEKADT